MIQKTFSLDEMKALEKATWLPVSNDSIWNCREILIAAKVEFVVRPWNVDGLIPGYDYFRSSLNERICKIDYLGENVITAVSFDLVNFFTHEGQVK